MFQELSVFVVCFTVLFTYKHMRSVWKKSSLVNGRRTVCDMSGTWQSRSGLECTCANNDDFTVLVSGGGRCG